MPTEKTRHYDSFDASSEWGTPAWVFDPLADALDGFDLDPASGAEPKSYADHRFTIEDNGLVQPWDVVDDPDVVLNPPYSRSANPAWALKVRSEVEAGNIGTLTALLPGSTSTDWYQENYAAVADYQTEIDERLSFHIPDYARDDEDDDLYDEGEESVDASFASIIVSVGEFPDDYLDALDDLGTVWRR